VTGLIKLDDGLDLLTSGLDDLDADAILQATDLITEGSSDINEVPVLVDELGAQRAGTC
jgi:hypothetical protein